MRDGSPIALRRARALLPALSRRKGDTMKQVALFICILGLVLNASAAKKEQVKKPSQGQQEQANSELSTNPSDQVGTRPPILGITWAKGVHHDFVPSGSPNMTFHGGKIMTQANVTAIFWGTTWVDYNGDEIAGLDSWYQGLRDSNYSKLGKEYLGSNGRAENVDYAGHYIDATSAADGDDTNAILAEVCKTITNPDPSGYGYYPVYTDRNRGNNNYCAYHGAGICQGIPVQFAFFFKLDGDMGCDPQDTSGLHSQGLSALANVSGHELSAARSDPNGDAWYEPTKSGRNDNDAKEPGSDLRGVNFKFDRPKGAEAGNNVQIFAKKQEVKSQEAKGPAMSLEEQTDDIISHGDESRPFVPGNYYQARPTDTFGKHENCAWIFGDSLVTLSNGTQWKMQGEWSNNAYNNGIGYPNQSGQRGCLDGNSVEPVLQPTPEFDRPKSALVIKMIDGPVTFKFDRPRK